MDVTTTPSPLNFASRAGYIVLGFPDDIRRIPTKVKTQINNATLSAFIRFGVRSRRIIPALFFHTQIKGRKMNVPGSIKELNAISRLFSKKFLSKRLKSHGLET